MKLALLFAIVVFVGVALARDIPEKKSARARLAHSKHSRAHKQRHASSKRDFNSELNDVLECVQEVVNEITQDDTSGLSSDEANQIFMDIVEYCETEGKDTDGGDDSTDMPTETEEGTDEGDDDKRRKLNQQKRHKARSHHAKAARAHEKKQ